MRIAIHDKDSTWSARWIEYCREHQISYGIVDCYSTDIITQLQSYDVLLWQFDHFLLRDILFARHILLAAQRMGLAVFPDLNTSWHYDDKIAQTYLLQAIDAPLAKTWIFYNAEEAHTWLQKDASYPLVAKLRRGSGSHNVQLVRNEREALRYCLRMFGKGIHPSPSYLSDSRHKLRTAGGLHGIIRRLKKAPRFFKEAYVGKRTFHHERGYVYFQQFLANNTHDTRVTVVGRRAFAFRRSVRQGDFRASGSGIIDYDPSQIDLRSIQIALDVSQTLAAQSLAFDFAFDGSNQPRIIEISYTFLSTATLKCPGYWSEDLSFVPGHNHIEDLILRNLLHPNFGDPQ